MYRKLKALARRILPAALVRRIRAWRLRRLIGRHKPKTVDHCYGGHELRIRLADPLATGWYDHDWPVLAEVRFLRGSRLRPGARVFDLGAHQGVVALMLAREVTPGGLVVAVEASPHNAAAARENARLNAADNLIVRCAAVSDRAGMLRFNEGLNGQVDDGTGGWGGVVVPAVTIDQLSAEYGPPAILFIDVEGFECHALRGAAETLARHRPDCFVEVHVGVGLEKFGSVSELLGYFPSDSYSLFRLDIDGDLPSPTTPEELRAIPRPFYLLAVAGDGGSAFREKDAVRVGRE